ncbi:hypothetical protein KBD61_05315 [Patescibacteria group bacterium]|nr:hypothetical protein [Patescibacteria group bacterium]MBP9710409.1 hypothetical protein [Patescibacteria group bacterium]
MEQIKNPDHLFRGVCESRSLEEFRRKLCKPSVDAARSQAVTEVLRDYAKEQGEIDALLADFDKRREDGGDLATTNDREEDKKRWAEIDKVLAVIEQIRAGYLIQAQEACEARDLITTENISQFRFRVVRQYQPTEFLEIRNVGSCLPSIGKNPEEHPASLTQLRSFVVHQAAFIKAKANLEAAIHGQREGRNPSQPIECIYVEPPEDNFFSRAIVNREGEMRRAHDFTPPILTRSVLSDTRLYNGLCIGLAQAARYNMLSTVLPGGLDKWAQSPEILAASHPTGAYIDLMMSQAFAYFSERNVALSPTALETYFSAHSAHTPFELRDVEDRLMWWLGLEEEADRAVFYPEIDEKLLLKKDSPNPFSGLVKIWEEGLAPVLIWRGPGLENEDRFGVAYTPLSEYMNPTSISDDKLATERAFSLMRQEGIRVGGPRTITYADPSVLDGIEDEETIAMLRRLLNIPNREE